MRFRSRHLACLLLLLATLGAAESNSQRDTSLTAGGRYISLLLSQRRAAAAVAEPNPESAASYKVEATPLPSSSRALHTAAWTMRPPSAHTAALQAATSFLI
jgi:hypothetical protein